MGIISCQPLANSKGDRKVGHDRCQVSEGSRRQTSVSRNTNHMWGTRREGYFSNHGRSRRTAETGCAASLKQDLPANAGKFVVRSQPEP